MREVSSTKSNVVETQPKNILLQLATLNLSFSHFRAKDMPLLAAPIARADPSASFQLEETPWRSGWPPHSVTNCSIENGVGR